MKIWLLTLPLNLILEVSNSKRVDPNIIMAIVSVESNGQTCATRYEPHYRYTFKEQEFADRSYISKDTETIQQKTSWGLMQVMGGVAREHGFTDPLIALCRPRKGLVVGITHFVKMFDRYNNNLNDAVSAYNQGGNYKKENGEYKNQKYVDKVIERYDFFRGIK